jgi:hypothetical protein
MGIASLSHSFKKLAIAAWDLQRAAGRLGWTVVAITATKASVAPYGIALQVFQKQRIDLLRNLVGCIVAYSR